MEAMVYVSSRVCRSRWDHIRRGQGACPQQQERQMVGDRRKSCESALSAARFNLGDSRAEGGREQGSAMRQLLHGQDG